MKRDINGICGQFCPAAPCRYCQFYGAGRGRLFSVGRGEHPWFPNLKSFRIFPRPGFLTPSLYRQHGPTGSHTWGLRSRLPNIAQPHSPDSPDCLTLPNLILNASFRHWLVSANAVCASQNINCEGSKGFNFLLVAPRACYGPFGLSWLLMV